MLPALALRALPLVARTVGPKAAQSAVPALSRAVGPTAARGIAAGAESPMVRTLLTQVGGAVTNQRHENTQLTQQQVAPPPAPKASFAFGDVGKESG